ncbi:hypothetical protein LSAT2_007690, partial [Lamellibrachia satsuma]
LLKWILHHSCLNTGHTLQLSYHRSYTKAVLTQIIHHSCLNTDHALQL